MAAIIALLLVVSLTLLVNRIATVALVLTGMSPDMARFQARSALSTVGFTTTESESVVNHPVRRRIVAGLMLFGNVGFVGVMAGGAATFTSNDDLHLGVRLGLLAAGLALLWAVAMSPWIERHLNRLIRWALARYTDLEIRDYIELLHLGAGYGVTELVIDPGDWLIGKRLEELRLPDAGVQVLGVQRAGGEFAGAPADNTYVRTGDKLIVYGARADTEALDMRKSLEGGFDEHRRIAAGRRAAAQTEPDPRHAPR